MYTHKLQCHVAWREDVQPSGIEQTVIGAVYFGFNVAQLLALVSVCTSVLCLYRASQRDWASARPL